MTRLRITLLAAAVLAGMPGAALAQDQGHDGRSGGEHHGGGDHGGGGDHRGGGPAAPNGGGPRGDAPRGPSPAQPIAPSRPDNGQRPGFNNGQPGMQDRRFQGGGWRGNAGNGGGGQPGQPARPPEPPRPDGGHDFGDRGRGGQGVFHPVPNGGGDDRRFDGNRGPGGQGVFRPVPNGNGDDRRFDGNRGQGRGGDGRGQGWANNGGYGRPGGSGFTPGRPDWRNDRRYDWRGYRDTHRDIFRAPRYAPPRGYGFGYRSFGVGYRLPAYFYAQDYWLDDPAFYSLPPVYGPYRWVRYYNDVLLVDLRTGAVVDVIRGFFW